jgi:hypothetical protein
MSIHRFRDSLEPTVPLVAAGAFASGFVLCPVAASVFPFVQELYRLALEAAQAQLRPARSWLPSFSLN